MKIRKALFLFFIFNLAQQKPIETMYFDFDKSDLTEQQTAVIMNFIKTIDTSKIESIKFMVTAVIVVMTFENRNE
ncbi:MAG: hypothetical protein ABI793_03090 [Flavobacterium sp.]